MKTFYRIGDTLFVRRELIRAKAQRGFIFSGLGCFSAMTVKALLGFRAAVGADVDGGVGLNVRA